MKYGHTAGGVIVTDSETGQKPAFIEANLAGGEQLYYELAVFHIDLKDELVPFELPSSPGRSFYANAGKSTRNGLETAISASTHSVAAISNRHLSVIFTPDL